MNKIRKWSKGFTLIEVLIVVVIIGILAALILPRFITVPERAVTAEGNQMIGALIRAQQQRADAGGGAVLNNPLVAGDWTTLGMVAPANGRFAYGCAGTSCTATRAAGNTISLDWTTNLWTCVGAYSAAPNGGGCQRTQ